MRTAIQTALNCFQENIHLFGNAKTEPEKFNLYNGLAQIAEAIDALAADVEAIKKTISIQRTQTAQR